MNLEHSRVSRCIAAAWVGVDRRDSGTIGTRARLLKRSWRPGREGCQYKWAVQSDVNRAGTQIEVAPGAETAGRVARMGVAATGASGEAAVQGGGLQAERESQVLHLKCTVVEHDGLEVLVVQCEIEGQCHAY